MAWAPCWLVLAAAGLAVAGGYQASATECFCRYENATAEEPLWTCGGGRRQYLCLKKPRRGGRSVRRGQAADRLAPGEFCGSGTPPCFLPGAAGIVIHAGARHAIADMILEVSCPDYLNCSDAAGYLTPKSASCEEGPAENATREDVDLVTSHERTVIPSQVIPFNLGRVEYAEPFGHEVLAEGDTLFVVSPFSGMVRVFHPAQLQQWSTVQAAEYSYPDNPLFIHGTIAYSNEAMLVQFQYNGPLPQGFTTAENAAWDETGQKLAILPRGKTWGTAPSVELRGHPGADSVTGAFEVGDRVELRSTINDPWERGTVTSALPSLQVKPDGGVTRTVSFNVLTLRYAENSGFGYAGDIDGGYAVVGAYSDARYETDFTGAGVAYFFERGSDGVWPLDAVQVVDQTPYRSFQGFGHIVAVEASGRAMVGSPGADTLHVFERGSDGVWAQTALLEDVCGGLAAAPWSVVTGSCTMDPETQCIQSPNYPSGYSDNDLCTIEVSPNAVPLQVQAFNTESEFDILTVNDVQYDGTTGPTGVTPSGTITWSTDGDVTASGWRLCPSYLAAPPTQRFQVHMRGRFAMVRCQTGRTRLYFRNDASWSQAPETLTEQCSSADIVDQGEELPAILAIGWASQRRVEVFERDPATGAWGSGRPLTAGAQDERGTGNPDGFGKSVALSRNNATGIAVAVGSNEKRVYVYTPQLIGRVAKTHAANFTSPAMWSVVSGSCTIDAETHCAQSAGYPIGYDNHQRCTIEVKESAVPLHVEAFGTESSFDFLTVNGVQYHGNSGPEGVTPSGTIAWYTDYSETGVGWRICPSEPLPEVFTLHFDTRHMELGQKLKLCVNLEGTGDAGAPEDFKDKGIGEFKLDWAPRQRHALEL